jgi:hypothetical protein
VTVIVPPVIVVLIRKPPAPVPFLPSVSQFESLSLFFRPPKNHLNKLKHRGNELNNDCGEKRPKRI